MDLDLDVAPATPPRGLCKCRNWDHADEEETLKEEQTLFHVDECCSQQCRHMGQSGDAPEHRNVGIVSVWISSMPFLINAYACI